MNKELTWQDAIQKVLNKNPGGVHYTTLTEIILSEGIKKQMGATPSDTVNSIITSSIKKSANTSPYIRLSPGVYALKKNLSPDIIEELEATSINGIQTDEENSQLNHCFGMYWRRNAVDWKIKPKILAAIDNNGFDVSNQTGIYLLHDGSKTVYVGQTEALGQRLQEHTKGRMAFRWDRFSWFGFRPIDVQGTLGTLPKSISTKKLMNALEAVLIETVEPSLNRKQGNGLNGIEYAQFIEEDKFTKLIELYKVSLNEN